MAHFMTCAELRLHVAGQDDAFAAACALLDSGQIGPHRFWWLATQFAIEAMSPASKISQQQPQPDLFEITEPH